MALFYYSIYYINAADFSSLSSISNLFTSSVLVASFFLSFLLEKSSNVFRNLWGSIKILMSIIWFQAGRFSVSYARESRGPVWDTGSSRLCLQAWDQSIPDLIVMFRPSSGASSCSACWRRRRLPSDTTVATLHIINERWGGVLSAIPQLRRTHGDVDTPEWDKQRASRSEDGEAQGGRTGRRRSAHVTINMDVELVSTQPGAFGRTLSRDPSSPLCCQTAVTWPSELTSHPLGRERRPGQWSFFSLLNLGRYEFGVSTGNFPLLIEAVCSLKISPEDKLGRQTIGCFSRRAIHLT